MKLLITMLPVEECYKNMTHLDDASGGCADDHVAFL